MRIDYAILILLHWKLEDLIEVFNNLRVLIAYILVSFLNSVKHTLKATH